MIALYCRMAIYTQQIHTHLRTEDPILAVENWEEFERTAVLSDCSIVVIEWLGRDEAFERFCSFKRHLPGKPVVLITREDADNVRFLKGVLVEEVLWIREIQKRLAPAVRSLRNGTDLQRIAEGIQQASHLPRTLRTALVSACLAPTPPRSVTSLAALAGCDRTTLWHHWTRTCAAASKIRLEDFLGWLLLIHAVARRFPGRRWSEIAAELVVHEHTLGRLSKRLTGKSLGDVSADGPVQLLDRFIITVLRPILSLDRSNKLG